MCPRQLDAPVTVGAADAFRLISGDHAPADQLTMGAPRMKVAILPTILVGLALAVLAILQHVAGIITADHVAIAFGVIGLIVFALGAFMALVRNN